MKEGSATLEGVVVNLDLSMELEPDNLTQSGDWTDFDGEGNPLEWRFPSHEQPDGWVWYGGYSRGEMWRQGPIQPLNRKGEPDRISVVITDPITEGDAPVPKGMAAKGAPPLRPRRQARQLHPGRHGRRPSSRCIQLRHARLLTH